MMQFRLFLFLALVLGFTACQSGEKEATTTEEVATEQSAEPVEMKKKYSLKPFSMSTPYPDAKIEGMTYENGQVTIEYTSDTYKLGEQTPDAAEKMCANSAEGQHVHFIVDNKPYAAHYVNQFEADIADGERYILAFLSRSYHESIKTEAASIVKKVTVADKSITALEDVSEPMLFYSRPKGTYVGAEDTKKVMLDFFIANLDLGDDYRVKANINGEEHIIDTWAPHYIEGLPMGKNTITLTLIDKDGKAYDTPLNPVTREFTLAPDPTKQEG